MDCDGSGVAFDDLLEDGKTEPGGTVAATGVVKAT